MPEKKILLLLEYTQTGGTRTYAKQLIEFYSQNGFELMVFALGPVNDSDMTEYCKQRGVVLHCIESFLPKAAQFKIFPFRLFESRRILKDLVKTTQSDLIVVSVGTPGLYLTYLNIGIRSIYILHTILEFDQSTAWWKRNLYMWIVLFLIPKECRFVTVSNYAAKSMSEHWGLRHGRQPTVIYNCSGELVSSSHENALSLNILTVGHVVDYKNPLFWIEIARLVIEQESEVIFTWVGDGPLLDVCREYIQSLGLSGNIQFVGKRNDVSEFYKNCDIYVQPSLIESFGIAVLDAMRYGKPSIVSRRGGLPEVIQDHVSGYVIDLDLGPKSFADHILELVNNEDLRSQLGHSAQHAYNETFSPQAWEQKMLTLHREMLFE